MRDLRSITHSYDTMSGNGVNVVNAMASGVDAAARTVTLEDGSTVDYDKLVLAPGIDFSGMRSRAMTRPRPRSCRMPTSPVRSPRS